MFLFFIVVFWACSYSSHQTWVTSLVETKQQLLVFIRICHCTCYCIEGIRKWFCIATNVPCKTQPSNHGFRALTINSAHRLLYLFMCYVVHFETLLCHMSARREFQPPWSLLRKPFRECWRPVNKHKGLAVKRGRPSSRQDVILPRNSAQPLVTCLGFFCTSCSFLLWFFFPKTFSSTRQWHSEIFSSPEISCF